MTEVLQKAAFGACISLTLGFRTVCSASWALSLGKGLGSAKGPTKTLDSFSYACWTYSLWGLKK